MRALPCLVLPETSVHSVFHLEPGILNSAVILSKFWTSWVSGFGYGSGYNLKKGLRAARGK